MSIFRRNLIALSVAAFVVAFAGCSNNRQVPEPQAPQNIPSVKTQQDGTKESNSAANEQVNKPQTVPDTDKKPAPKIGFTQKYIALNWIDNGKVRMKAKSREFKGDEVTKQGVFLDFSAELYENGKLTATLAAPKAVVDGNKRTVVASGGVKMKSLERASSLVAENVTWYAKQKKVVGSGGVKMDSTNGQITAAEIVTDTTLRNITVRGSK